jgi:S-adenosylmethionine:tRNA ribosyltransferase-isomerase
MDVALFDYALPPALIAQEPIEPRDASRLLVLDRDRSTRADRRFADLPDLLRAGDCLVINQSRVVPARLAAADTTGRPVELLLVRALAPDRWEALVRPARRVPVGAHLAIGQGEADARVVDVLADGMRVLAFAGPARELLDRHGILPLPPYIHRHQCPKPEDWQRYQTVYAREEGSIAAPTAGLHFTTALLECLRARGIEVHSLTLHVGIGTFRPVRTARVEAHRMHAEEVTISAETAGAVNRAQAEGRRVVAVGTTTTRALEWAAGASGHVRAGRGAADLFIYPGHRFRVVDALITNFHLPRSTLLMLVAALAGREPVLDAYRYAAAAGYRFYSYGDAMLIE